MYIFSYIPFEVRQTVLFELYWSTAPNILLLIRSQLCITWELITTVFLMQSVSHYRPPRKWTKKRLIQSVSKSAIGRNFKLGVRAFFPEKGNKKKQLWFPIHYEVLELLYVPTIEFFATKRSKAYWKCDKKALQMINSSHCGCENTGLQLWWWNKQSSTFRKQFFVCKIQKEVMKSRARDECG